MENFQYLYERLKERPEMAFVNLLAQSRPKPKSPMPSLPSAPPKMNETQSEFRTARQTILKEPSKGAIYCKDSVRLNSRKGKLHILRGTTTRRGIEQSLRPR